VRHPFCQNLSVLLTKYSGCEPLTPEDIAEIIVFAAGRRENVVLADTLVFPNHQVRAWDSIRLANWKTRS